MEAFPLLEACRAEVHAMLLRLAPVGDMEDDQILVGRRGRHRVRDGAGELELVPGARKP